MESEPWQRGHTHQCLCHAPQLHRLMVANHMIQFAFPIATTEYELQNSQVVASSTYCTEFLFYEYSCAILEVASHSFKKEMGVKNMKP